MAPLTWRKAGIIIQNNGPKVGLCGVGVQNSLRGGCTMRSWSLTVIAFLLVFASLAFAQVGHGTIPGTITDPAGAVVAAAAVEAKNAETGVVYRATSTNTGNYTIG